MTFNFSFGFFSLSYIIRIGVNKSRTVAFNAFPCFKIVRGELNFDFTAAVPMDDERMWGYTVAWHPDRPLTEEEVARIESWRGVYTELVPGTYESTLSSANDYGIDREKQRTESFTGIRGIREQDLPVQEDQWGPISNRPREHLGTTDLAIIAMRRKLLRTLRGLQEGVEPPEAHNAESYRVRSAAFIAPQSAVWYEVPEAGEWMSPQR